MVHEQVGNRAIPMVSVAGPLAIMAILMLNRSVDGREPLSPGEEGRNRRAMHRAEGWRIPLKIPA